MSEQKSSRSPISEDWLAVIIGFVLTALTWIGVLATVGLFSKYQIGTMKHIYSWA